MDSITARNRSVLESLMPDQQPPQIDSGSNSSESFGTFPNHSEGFRRLPNDSEPFRTIPKDAEPFGSFPKSAERKEYCTLTVREVARMFEAAGVARTERSITNWCQPNKMGLARLDNYFDPNERKYFISPQSVELVIQEEKAKAAKNDSIPAPVDDVPKPSEKKEKTLRVHSESDLDKIQELETEVRDLQIATRVKDKWIERLEQEKEAFADERRDYVEKLLTVTRQVGQLETKLLWLEGREQHGTAILGGSDEVEV